MKIFFSVLALAALLTPAALSAAEKPRKPAAQSSMRAAKKSIRRSSEGTVTAGTTVTEVLAKSFAVDAGGSRSFDSAGDYSGAQFVSIAIEAPTDVNIGTENFRVIVWWAVPDAEWYTAQDVFSGTTFYFSNQGGMVLPVYGSELRIEIRNDGDQAVSINQVTLYAVTK
ncbi:MAG TPA: hypothetical protein VN442_05500 [Bryobacteraceae bacterium]|nr:hypothetical protein [Bryobacteraceae bacterium]